MVRDLEALVLPAGTGNTSLLGMNYLRSLSSYEVKADKMIMRN
jgi:predicted aspartyl protease